VPALKDELSAPLRTMQEIAKTIAKVSKECRMDIKEEDYVASFKIALMDAVFRVSSLA
jgi:ATP-dependent RNA helicase DOB1